MILFMFYFVGSLHCKGPLLFYYLKVCTMKWQNQEMLGFHQEKLTVTQVQNSCEWVQLEEGWFRSTPRSKTIHGKANRLWNPPKTCFYTVNVAAIFTNFYHLCEGEVVPDLVQNEVHSQFLWPKVMCVYGLYHSTSICTIHPYPCLHCIAGHIIDYWLDMF